MPFLMIQVTIQPAIETKLLFKLAELYPTSSPSAFVEDPAAFVTNFHDALEQEDHKQTR